MRFVQIQGKGRKKKNIQDAEFDYYNMDREADEDIEMTDDELSHIVEIYDFSQEFKTEDLLKLFESSQLVFSLRSHNNIFSTYEMSLYKTL